MELAMVGALLVTCAVALVHGATRGGARRPRVAPTIVAIASAPEGVRVRIVGRIVAIPDPLPTMEGGAAGYRHLRIAANLGSRRRTILLLDDTSCAELVVDDGTGRAVIDPSRADVALRPTPVDADARARTVLAQHGIELPSGTTSMRCREAALRVGDWIVVDGFGTREPDPDGASASSGYRELLPTRLHLAVGPQRPLEIRRAEDHERPTAR